MADATARSLQYEYKAVSLVSKFVVLWPRGYETLLIKLRIDRRQIGILQFSNVMRMHGLYLQPRDVCSPHGKYLVACRLALECSWHTSRRALWLAIKRT